MMIGGYMKYLEKVKSTTIVSSIMYILIGLVMVIFPEFVNDFIWYIIGGLIVVFGILQLMNYFSTPYKNFLTGVVLLISLASIALGVYVIFSPEKLISLVPLTIGVIMIVDGIQKLIQIQSIKKAGYDNPIALLIYALLLIVLGIILIKNPFGAILTVIRIIGVFLITDAIEELITVKKYERAFKNFKDNVSHSVKIIEEEK